MLQKTQLSWRLRGKVQSQRLIVLLVTQIWRTTVIKLVWREKYAFFFKGQNLTVEVDSVWQYLQERFHPCANAGFVLSAFWHYSRFDMVGSQVSLRTSCLSLLLARRSSEMFIKQIRYIFSGSTVRQWCPNAILYVLSLFLIHLTFGNIAVHQFEAFYSVITVLALNSWLKRFIENFVGMKPFFPKNVL